MGVGRMPVVNSVVWMPPDLWALGWSPQFTGDHNTTLPPIPVRLLQETDVLKQFIFRFVLQIEHFNFWWAVSLSPTRKLFMTYELFITSYE